jgi:hypothetical protein
MIFFQGNERVWVNFSKNPILKGYHNFIMSDLVQQEEFCDVPKTTVSSIFELRVLLEDTLLSKEMKNQILRYCKVI